MLGMPVAITHTWACARPPLLQKLGFNVLMLKDPLAFPHNISHSPHRRNGIRPFLLRQVRRLERFGSGDWEVYIH